VNQAKRCRGLPALQIPSNSWGFPATFSVIHNDVPRRWNSTTSAAEAGAGCANTAAVPNIANAAAMASTSLVDLLPNPGPAIF
jgi:hypothetical protein